MKNIKQELIEILTYFNEGLKDIESSSDEEQPMQKRIEIALRKVENLTIPVVRQRFSKIPKKAEVIIKWTDDKAEQHEVKYNETEIENAEIHIGLMTGNICEGDLEP